MRKHILIFVGVVVFLLILAAQNQREMGALIIDSFIKRFPEAQNVKSTPMKGQVEKAPSGHQGKSLIAFFSEEADLISSGKKIRNISTLPRLVADALKCQKSRLTKKFNILNRVTIFQFASGNTARWYSTLANQKALIVVSTDATGYSVVESRKINKWAPEMPTPAPSNDLIAKQ